MLHNPKYGNFVSLYKGPLGKCDLQTMDFTTHAGILQESHQAPLMNMLTFPTLGLQLLLQSKPHIDTKCGLILYKSALPGILAYQVEIQHAINVL